MSYEVSEEKRIELSKILKFKREEKGLKINQLSLKSNVNKSLISRIEKGQLLKINPFLIKKICSALSINYLDIFKLVGFIDEHDFESPKSNFIENISDNVEEDDLTLLIKSLPKEDLKEMLEEFLLKKELKAYKDGTYEELKEEFDLIRQAIDYGIED